MPLPAPDQLFGVYIHWPFCARVCPYCDFNVYTAKSRDTLALEAAILSDLKAHAELTPGRKLTSLYFGGGTPSLCRPDFLKDVIEHCETLWPSKEPIEITLETNPEDVTPGALNAWKSAGINRLSLGVQALNDEALKFLGRNHSRGQALTAIEAALSVFPNTTIDMIYARPGQSIEDWKAELSEALGTGAPHISLYELTIKEKTAFAKQVERERFTPLDDDAQADLYSETLRQCADAGLPAYEVSNHARSEAFWSQHNLTYWQSGEWLGIGPGAEGKLNLDSGRTTTQAARKVSDYIEAVESTGTGWADSFTLSGREAAEEALILGLRSKMGVERAKLECLFGEPLNDVKLTSLKESGHLLEEDGRLKLTEEGWLLADYISVELTP